MQASVFCPVYLDSLGNQIIIPLNTWVATDQQGAFDVATRNLNDTILLGLRFSEVRELNLKDTPNVAGLIGQLNIVIIGGPQMVMFLEAQVRSVQVWQADEGVKPLRCARDVTHEPLSASVEDCGVVLRCVAPNCGYCQALTGGLSTVLVSHARFRQALEK